MATGKAVAVRCALVAAVLFVLTGCAGLDKGTGRKAFVMRVNCGAMEPYTDQAGNKWLADQEKDDTNTWGAVGGMTVGRYEVAIPGTEAPTVYLNERYGMSAYEFALAPGKYTVRLHFAETYEDVLFEGERVFTVKLNGEAVLEDLDPFKAGGGQNKPVVREFKGVKPVDGKLLIEFVESNQRAEINGIEIISE